MRAALLFICCLCVPPGDDAYKILQDPARRVKEFDRQTALKAFRELSKESASAWVATRFLEKTDRQWRLTYDRLKTSSGVLLGEAEGPTFVSFSGARAPVSSGALEKGVRDPAGVELDLYLKTYWTGALLSDADHRKAIESLELSIGKAGSSEGVEALKLFLLAHASVLGDRASDILTKFGLAKEGDRWGRKEDLALFELASGIAKRTNVPEEAESRARSSTALGPRYALEIFDLWRVFNANQGYEAAHKQLLGWTGPSAPPRVAGHFKALADSLKNAVFCRVCKDGKITCDQCQGKKRVDVKCPVCHGIGWAQKPGAPGATLIRCYRCAGMGTFRNAGCPGCRETGVVTCPVCNGKPWRSGFLGCRDCTICEVCHGRKQIQKDCPTCHGKGRVGPYTAGIPTQVCDTCRGTAVIVSPCATCKETGLAPCRNCGNGVRDGKFRAKVEDVYTAVPCPSCGGKGFPLPNLAVPCERCMGLSFVVQPTSDPSKTLVE